MRTAVAPRGAFWLLAALLGGGYLVSLVGLAPLNPLDSDWLLQGGDPRQHYLGWELYRQDPDWSFPPTFTDHIGYPRGTSLAYTDSIPLLAVFFKVISRILPDGFQYFGWFLLASFVLHAVLAVRIATLLAPDDRLFSMLGGAVLLLAPPLTFKLTGHLSLTSHWLILWSLLLYLRVGESNSLAGIRRQQQVMVVLASGIHPYLAVMCLVMNVAGLARGGMLGILSRRRILLSTFYLAVLLLAGWLVFGYFSEGGSLQGGSYGFYSLNLLAPFNSMGLSETLKPVSWALDGQYEGYNFLGVGVLLLLILTLPFLPRSLPRLLSPGAEPATWACLVLTVFSISNTVTFGPATLFVIELPHVFDKAAEIFRSSGRMFWPVHYWIVIGLLLLLKQHHGRRTTHWILLLAILVQYLDLGPLRESATRWIHSDAPVTALTSPRWGNLALRHSKLLVLPAWQCDQETSMSWRDSMRIAARQGMVTNSYYGARFGREAWQVHCVEMPERFLAGQLEPDAAYVLDRRLYARTFADSGAPASHACELVDGLILCEARRPGAPESPVLADVVPAFPHDGVMEFGAPPDALLLDGWTTPGTDRTLTTGDGRFAFKLGPERQKRYAFFELDLFGFLPGGTQGYEILLNDTVVARGTLTSAAPEITERIPIPASPSGLYMFRIISSNPSSPAALGMSADTRTFGMGLRRVRLAPFHEKEP